MVTCTLRFWASASAAATMVLMAAKFSVFFEGRSAADKMGMTVRARIAATRATRYSETIAMTIPFSRRGFLRGAAGTVLLAPQSLAASGPVPAGERVRFGMIGIGM